jgi:hypothetical protein
MTNRTFCLPLFGDPWNRCKNTFSLMRAMIFLVFSIASHYNKCQEQETEFLYLLHNYSVFIKLSLSIKYCALSVPLLQAFEDLNKVIEFNSVFSCFKTIFFFDKNYFYCSLMLASEPKYPEWVCFNNTLQSHQSGISDYYYLNTL